MSDGIFCLIISKTVVELPALGINNTSSFDLKYTIKSSTTVPFSERIVEYWACPGLIRFISFVKTSFRRSAAFGPVNVAVPKWETSKIPTASLVAPCSARTPPPAYSSGISQPPNGASFAPNSIWRWCSGE